MHAEVLLVLVATKKADRDSNWLKSVRLAFLHAPPQDSRFHADRWRRPSSLDPETARLIVTADHYPDLLLSAAEDVAFRHAVRDQDAVAQVAASQAWFAPEVWTGERATAARTRRLPRRRREPR